MLPPPPYDACSALGLSSSSLLAFFSRESPKMPDKVLSLPVSKVTFGFVSFSEAQVSPQEAQVLRQMTADIPSFSFFSFNQYSGVFFSSNDFLLPPILFFSKMLPESLPAFKGAPYIRNPFPSSFPVDYSFYFFFSHLLDLPQIRAAPREQPSSVFNSPIGVSYLRSPLREEVWQVSVFDLL